MAPGALPALGLPSPPMAQNPILAPGPSASAPVTVCPAPHSPALPGRGAPEPGPPAGPRPSLRAQAFRKWWMPCSRWCSGQPRHSIPLLLSAGTVLLVGWSLPNQRKKYPVRQQRELHRVLNFQQKTILQELVANLRQVVNEMQTYTLIQLSRTLLFPSTSCAFTATALEGCVLGFCGLSIQGLNYQGSSIATSVSSVVVWYWITFVFPLQLHPLEIRGCEERHSLSLWLRKTLEVRLWVHLLASEIRNQNKQKPSTFINNFQLSLPRFKPSYTFFHGI